MNRPHQHVQATLLQRKAQLQSGSLPLYANHAVSQSRVSYYNTYPYNGNSHYSLWFVVKSLYRIARPARRAQGTA